MKIELSVEETDALRTAVSKCYDFGTKEESAQLGEVLSFLQNTRQVTLVNEGVNL